jgi:peptidyl-prolyl cis-trans isomerase C
MTIALEGAQTAAPITVNGVEIKRAAISQETQHHPSATPDEAMQCGATALVVRELLLQEARRQDLRAAPEVDERGRRESKEEALIRALLEREIATPAPTGDEITRYYASNQSRFRSPDLYEASHILIAARRDDDAAFAAARAKAEVVAADIIECPDNFAGMAQAFSDCPSGREGGRLGQVCERDVTPEFAETLRTLTAGEVTIAPIETPYGFHIIRLDRHQPGDLLPLDLVAGRIAGYLSARSERTATAQFVARLVSAAKICGIVLAGAETHRVF